MHVTARNSKSNYYYCCTLEQAKSFVKPLFFIFLNYWQCLIAHGGVVCNCMSRAKLFMNPLIEGPGTIFGW